MQLAWSSWALCCQPPFEVTWLGRRPGATLTLALWVWNRIHVTGLSYLVQDVCFVAVVVFLQVTRHVVHIMEPSVVEQEERKRYRV